MFAQSVNQSRLVILTMTFALCACIDNDISSIEGANEASNDNKALFEIVVTVPGNDIFLPTQLAALGKYDDGSQSDISGLVNWSTVTPGVLSIDATGLATPTSVGTTAINASLDGIFSIDQNVSVTDSKICGLTLGQPLSKNPGGGIDDTDGDNGAGACVKLREIVDTNDSNTKLFTSSPSEDFLLSLGYAQANSSTNSGLTYGFVANTFVFAPTGSFANFRNDGASVASNADSNGQYERYCADLAARNFAGYSTWRRATSDELIALNDFENAGSQSLFTRFGWPVNDAYHSSTVNGAGFTQVNLTSGTASTSVSTISSGNNASCVTLVE